MNEKNNNSDDIKKTARKDYAKYMMIGVFLLLIIIVFILLSNNKTSKISDNTLKQDTNLAESNKSIIASTKAIKEDSDNLKYILNIEYPEIIGINNLDIQNKINKKIKDNIDNSIKDFKKNVNEYDSDDIPIEQKSGLWIKYKYYKSLEDVISIVLSKSEYYKGAAHPNNNDFIYNFNLSTGDIIEFDDLFINNSDYLKYISDYVTRELDIRFQEYGWFKEGALPKKENYQFFIINKGFITFVFNPYQVGPYAIGVVEVNILNKDLKDVLKPEWQ